MALVNGIAKSQWPFSPQCLPNCLLWLDAADTSTYVTGSSSITSWRNKGFAGGSAAGGGGTINSTTINGIPSLSFGASSYIIASPINFTQTTRTIFTVQQLGPASTITLLQSSGDNTYFSIFYDSAGLLVFEGVSTYIYRTNSLGSFFNNISITCFTQPTTNSTGGIFINGTAVNLVTSNSYSFPVGISDDQTIGWNTTTAFTMGETMIFDGAISDIQRQQVEGYLASKWGLRPQLPQTHPYFSNVITSVPATSLFSPTSITGCQLWLDAADQSTVIVSGTGSAVYTWNDKSGSGNTMSAVGGSGTTTYTRFGPGLSIKLNSSYLVCTGKNINLTNFSLFAVSLSQVATNNTPLLSGIPTAPGQYDYNSQNGFATYIDSNAEAQNVRLYNTLAVVSNTIATTSIPQPLNLQSYTVASGGSINSWINGVTGSIASSPARTSGTAGFAIGASYTIAGSVFNNVISNANVYEILVYNSVLSTSDRQAVEGYLMSKWGCGRNLSIDASDTTTIPAISTITSLYDKSGNGGTPTITGSPTLQQIAGRPYIYLNGTSWFTGPVSITGTLMTAFAVISIPANSGNPLFEASCIISLGVPSVPDYQSSAYASALYLGNNSKTINTYRYPASYPSYITNTSSAPIIASAIYNGSSGLLYQNGVASIFPISSSGTFGITNYGIGTGLYESNHPPNNSYFNGYIGEVILYNAALTETERQQVETYLGNKWGIGIPTPTSGITAPTDIAGCKLWLDAYSAGVPITTINDKSGNGRTATSTGSASPILTAYGINGRPAIYFPNPSSGVTPSYFFRGSVPLSGSSASTFVVCTPILSTTSGNPRILSFGDGTSNADFGQSNLGLPLDQENSTFNAYRFSNNVGGTAITPGTSYIMDTVFTGTTISLYKNGGTPVTATHGSLSFNVTQYTLACYNASTTALFTGYIGEVIIYNTALTDTQRRQVETYLSNKWGIAVATPTSAITAPTDIAGCQLWLDATSIPQINDKTGNGYNLTQVTTVNQPTLSNNYLNFGTAANLYMNMPAAAINNATAWTMFLVINPNSSINWIMAKSSSSLASTTLSTTYYPKFAFGATNPAQGITNRLYFQGLDLSGSPIILSQPQLITLRYDGSTMSYYVNGTLSASTAGSFTIPNQLSPDYSTLGAWILSAGSYANSGQTNFALGELDFYRSALSTTLIQQIGLYIMNKWNINPSVSFSISSFSLTSIPGCVIWLDAADTTTYNASSFTTWTNKGTAGGSTGSKSGTITSSTINGTSALSFAANAGIIYPGSSITYANTTRTVFVVASIGASGSSTDYFFLNNSNNLRDVTLQIRGSAAGGYAGISLWSGNSVLVYQVNPTPTGIFNTPSVFCGTSSTTNGGIFVNGTKITSGSPSNQFITGANGGQSIGLASATAAFTLGEVIIFDGAITDFQRQQVNNYLQTKWNIGTTNAPINNRHFAPIDISGCGLWLDAADASTISGTTWSDKSGGGYNVTSTNTIATTSAGITINSTANNRLTNSSIPVPTTYSLFTVGQTTSASAGGTYYRIVHIGGGSNNFYGYMGTLGSSFTTFTGNGSAWNDVAANTPTQTLSLNTQYLMGMTVNGSVLTPYFNSTALNTKTGTTNAITGIYIGGAQDSSQLWNGNVAEVILYRALLTNSQRLQVESYLAQKWGIRGSLPTTHPGYTLPAFGTVFTPKSIGSMQLWLDAADTSTLDLSGTSVIVWRDKSGLNNTMNVLPAAPAEAGYTAAYPIIGTPINNGNTVYFSPAAGLKQATTLTGVTNFYWVGRISNIGTGIANGAYMMLGHDTHYYWHGNTFTTPSSQLLSSANAAAGIRAATPTSLYTSDSTSAAVNTTFGALNMPVNAAIHLISTTGITGSTDYQGICYDRSANIGWCGDLAEVIIFTTALSTYQHKQMEGYLAWKWGLQAQLPATHPYYKSRP
jgi:hypothetical protein